MRNERIDITLVVGNVLQSAAACAGREVESILVLGPRARPQGRSQPLLEPFDAGVPQRRQDDLDQPIVLAIVVCRHRLEDPVGEPHRIGGRLQCGRAEVIAGPTEHVADLALAIVDPVQHGLGQFHEPPQQLQRQVGAVLGHLLDDQLALQIEILDERSPLWPVDEGPALAQGGEPFADGAGNGLRAGLGAELEPQPALDPGVPDAELEQQLGEPARAQRFEVGEVDHLLRPHRATILVSCTHSQIEKSMPRWM